MNTKLFILLLGLMVPLFLFLKFSRTPPLNEKPSFVLESQLTGVSILQPIWLVFLLSSLVLRIYKLGCSDWWPGGDESLNALEAVALFNHWRWIPFVNISQIPSTLSYLCYLVLKTTHAPLLGTQIPPAVISILTLWAGYHAARIYFSRLIAFILIALMAFHYWLLTISNVFLPGITLPLWEFGVLYFLGRFLKSGPSKRKYWACGLGLFLGLGPYTFFPWPVLFLLIFVTMSWILWKDFKNNIGAAFIFILFFILSLLPFLYSIRTEKYGGYLMDNSLMNGFDWMKQVRLIGSYGSGLFFGGLAEGTWRPFGGGFLNVILSSCFFVGLVELYKFRREPVSRFLGGAAVLFLLPGILSRDIEFHRILLVLPILLIFTVIGLQALILSLNPGKRIPVLIAFILLSSCIDVSRSGIINLHSQNEQKAYFDFLNLTSKEQGPGFVFSDMVTNPPEYSLTYCSYFFNAALNPKLPDVSIQWAALFTERQYVPFLSARFPQSRWLNLPIGQTGISSRYSLGFFSLNPKLVPLFNSWKDFYAFNQEINLQIIDIPSRQNRRKILTRLIEFYPSLPPDPFLQSLFFEKLLFNYSWEKTFHPEDAWVNGHTFSNLFQQSFGKSYRDEVLCEKYGRLLATEGEKSDARRMFEKALVQSPGNPLLLQEIRELDVSSP